MQVFKEIAALQGWRRQLEVQASAAPTVGFVPTMGALHAGHLALLQTSVAANDYTVLSIFVNATQFNDPKDLTHYPSSLTEDLQLARDAGVAAVLLPAHADLYPDDYRYRVSESQFSQMLCGAHRPGHFDGVLSVVLKLLNIVAPSHAYFGLKDYQQYLLIKEMCQALFVPVAIVGCETVREADGLALSSRNRRLTPEARRIAAQLNQILRQTVDEAEATDQLTAAGMEVDYVAAVDGRRLAAVNLAIGNATIRLIDNVSLGATDAG